MLKAFGHNAQHQRLNASDRFVARLTVYEDSRQVVTRCRTDPSAGYGYGAIPIATSSVV